VVLLKVNMLVESTVSLHTMLLMPGTNFGPDVKCEHLALHVVHNIRDDPLSVTLNLHAERWLPQTAGDLDISNFMILNTFKSHTRRIRLFAVPPDEFNLLTVVNSTQPNIQSKTGTRFPTLHTLQTSQTRTLKYCHLCQGQKCNQAPALR
jgi:hypothetical protein